MIVVSECVVSIVKEELSVGQSSISQSVSHSVYFSRSVFQSVSQSIL
jgi:hypothetical protein